MKNKNRRQKSPVQALLLVTGSAFAISACAPIIAEFSAGTSSKPKQTVLTCADIDASTKGDAR